MNSSGQFLKERKSVILLHEKDEIAIEHARNCYKISHIQFHLQYEETYNNGTYTYR